MTTGEQPQPDCSPVDVIETLAYKPGWTFKVGGPLGQFLCVRAVTVDSANHSTTRATGHMFRMPEQMPRQDFVRWVYLCVLDAERHEAGEFFTTDGDQPFYPHHQDEGSPYAWVERWDTA